MKRAILSFVAALMFMLPAGLFAQNHAEISVFGDYYRQQAINENLFGIGGRIGFAVHPNIKLEADLAYDFEHNYSTTISGAGCGTNVTTCTGSNGLRATSFSFGPKFQFGKDSPIRAFIFTKGGFVRFGSSSTAVTLGNFPTGLSNRDVNGTFYPGGGLELFAGWFGIRGDVGDQIYFDRGAHNNIRITFGPVIRF